MSSLSEESEFIWVGDRQEAAQTPTEDEDLVEVHPQARRPAHAWRPPNERVCRRCGETVDPLIRRVAGDNRGRVDWCPACTRVHGMAGEGTR